MDPTTGFLDETRTLVQYLLRPCPMSRWQNWGRGYLGNRVGRFTILYHISKFRAIWSVWSIRIIRDHTGSGVYDGRRGVRDSIHQSYAIIRNHTVDQLWSYAVHTVFIHFIHPIIAHHTASYDLSFHIKNWKTINFIQYVWYNNSTTTTVEIQQCYSSDTTIYRLWKRCCWWTTNFPTCAFS